MTAAWPFVTAAAFATPTNEVVVVVMNEADTTVQFTLKDSHRPAGSNAANISLHAHSIKTLIYNK